jgi:hypothetical protein
VGICATGYANKRGLSLFLLVSANILLFLTVYEPPCVALQKPTMAVVDTVGRVRDAISAVLLAARHAETASDALASLVNEPGSLRIASPAAALERSVLQATQIFLTAKLSRFALSENSFVHSDSHAIATIRKDLAKIELQLASPVPSSRNTNIDNPSNMSETARGWTPDGFRSSASLGSMRRSVTFADRLFSESYAERRANQSSENNVSMTSVANAKEADLSLVFVANTDQGKFSTDTSVIGAPNSNSAVASPDQLKLVSAITYVFNCFSLTQLVPIIPLSYLCRTLCETPSLQGLRVLAYSWLRSQASTK